MSTQVQVYVSGGKCSGYVSHKHYNPQRQLGPPSTINTATMTFPLHALVTRACESARSNVVSADAAWEWVRGRYYNTLHYVLA